MILKSPSSRLSIVNLLADFILNKIPKEEESIIQVVDCLNFYVIKGKTTYTTPLDIATIKDEFISKHESLLGDIKMTHTIDLIEYESKLSKVTSSVFTYHDNHKNCSYHSSQIQSFNVDPTKSYDFDFVLKEISEDQNFIFTSEFPHGYSLNQGRLLYYYGKHIFYNIPPVHNKNTFTFVMSTEKGEDGDQMFYIIHNQYKEERLTSAVLDMFDFDMTWLETQIKKVDWSVELTNPLEDYDFLKVKIKDFVVF
jgi:hypothetical protein